MTCIPKHIACDWYNPVDDAGFVAGNESCVLQIIPEEKRARLEIGGSFTRGKSFFRSKGVGKHTNNITISCTWQVQYGSPNEWHDYDPNIFCADDVGRVKLVVTDRTYTETWYANQSITNGPSTPVGSPCSVSAIGSPAGWVGVWSSAIPELRSQLNTSSALVEMPTSDVVGLGWNSGTNDGDFLYEFGTTNLTGGDGGDSTPSGLYSIRTGPILTIVFVQSSEIDNSNGSQNTSYNKVKYWNGAGWKEHSNITPECVGSPIVCSPIGPWSDI